MKPGGMQLAARRSEGISLPSETSQGLAPWAASLRILEPEISMKSSGRLMSLAYSRKDDGRGGLTVCVTRYILGYISLHAVLLGCGITRMVRVCVYVPS